MNRCVTTNSICTNVFVSRQKGSRQFAFHPNKEKNTGVNNLMFVMGHRAPTLPGCHFISFAGTKDALSASIW